MTGQRLRLTTSRPAGYRRGGQVIGNAGAPTFVQRGDMTLEQVLAVLRDPNVAMAVETEDGVFMVMTADERAAIKDGILSELGQLQPDTDGPQGDGLTPDAKAPQATGSQDAATAADSTASAGGAVTHGLLAGGGELSAERTEPTAQPIPPAPEPAAKPTPASKGRGKAKGTPA